MTQTFSVFVRQWSKQKSVRHTEDRSVGANADCGDNTETTVKRGSSATSESRTRDHSKAIALFNAFPVSPAASRDLPSAKLHPKAQGCRALAATLGIRQDIKPQGVAPNALVWLTFESRLDATPWGARSAARSQVAAKARQPGFGSASRY